MHELGHVEIEACLKSSVDQSRNIDPDFLLLASYNNIHYVAFGVVSFLTKGLHTIAC